MDRDGSGRESALDEAEMGFTFLVCARDNSRSQRTTGQATQDHRDVGASDDQPGPSMAS